MHDLLCLRTLLIFRKLSSLGLKGTLSGDVGQLTELKSLNLSSNTQLGGPLTPNIGSLTKLTTLILAGCSFIGNIPDTLGKLEQLSFLALNSNKFTGRLPALLGQLANLYWLNIAENQLTGPLPVSRNKAPGLDLLLKTKHLRRTIFWRCHRDACKIFWRIGWQRTSLNAVKNLEIL